MRTAVLLHDLLVTVEATVCLPCGFHSYSLYSRGSWQATKFVFNLARFLDELVDLVVARQRACGCMDHLDCDRVVVPLDVGWLWFYELALVVWRCCGVFEFAAELLCFGLVVVFRGGVDVVCSCCLLYVHHRADRNVSMC